MTELIKMFVQAAIIGMTAGLWSYMFTEIWTKQGEVFGFVSRWHYMNFEIGKYKDSKYKEILFKLLFCAKCQAVWVSLILYFFVPIKFCMIIFLVSIASFVGYKLQCKNNLI